MLAGAACCLHAIPHRRNPSGTGGSSSERGGWRALGRADGRRDVEVTLALKLEPGGVKALRQKFLACSDPRGGAYARYWDRETLSTTVRAQPGAAEGVEAWLALAGVRVLDESAFPGGRVAGFVRARGPVAAIERAFAVELWTYGHTGADPQVATTIVRTAPHISRDGGDGIPPPLKPYLAFINGLDEFPAVPARNPAGPLAPSAASPSVTPARIRELYGLANISEWLGGEALKGSQGAAGWQHQSFSPSDLARFQQRHGLDALAIRRIYGRNSGWGHVEGNLDVEYLTAVALVADAAGVGPIARGAGGGKPGWWTQGRHGSVGTPSHQAAGAQTHRRSFSAGEERAATAAESERVEAAEGDGEEVVEVRYPIGSEAVRSKGTGAGGGAVRGARGVATDYWLSGDSPFGMGFDIVGWAARLLAEEGAALVWSVRARRGALRV